jgi:acyl-CoA carboxylase subunit beta
LVLTARPKGNRRGTEGDYAYNTNHQVILPPGFQTAEFLLEHRLVDAIIHRKEMKAALATYLDFLSEGRRHRAMAAA